MYSGVRRAMENNRRKAPRGQVAGGGAVESTGQRLSVGQVSRTASQGGDRCGGEGGCLRAVKGVRAPVFILAEPLEHFEERKGCVLSS